MIEIKGKFNTAMAYKNMDEIVENIEPTAEIIACIKPIYNFKAAE